MSFILSESLTRSPSHAGNDNSAYVWSLKTGRLQVRAVLPRAAAIESGAMWCCAAVHSDGSQQQGAGVRLHHGRRARGDGLARPHHQGLGPRQRRQVRPNHQRRGESVVIGGWQHQWFILLIAVVLQLRGAVAQRQHDGLRAPELAHQVNALRFSACFFTLSHRVCRFWSVKTGESMHECTGR